MHAYISGIAINNTYRLTHLNTYHAGVTVGFIDASYTAREDEGVMIFTVGVTSGHILDRDIELSFSTADIARGGIYHPFCMSIFGTTFMHACLLANLFICITILY